MSATVKRRADYRPPDYRIGQVRLDVRIGAAATTVVSELEIERAAGAPADAPLALDGRELELREVAVDGRVLAPGEYRLEAERLVLPAVPARFRLRSVTHLDPDANSALEGLYRSGPMLCTQCEAHGFSRIAYFPDRPDVLARFRVRVEADAARYPVLLANGNCVEAGPLDGGRHYAVWDDPFPKPAYLFALVAGDLAEAADDYVTRSGRKVRLRFFVDRGNEGRVEHALASLKRAMRWDEDAYGLEYDLDTYMVVAARDFNMGAMENKGLNLFNAAYVLASPDTATDQDYENIEAVVGHEYFHNWTGNRVTCRDWFQLSLKEGLTVFREQQFSAAMGSAAAKRIAEIKLLRARQFPEDAGPMAHPVRPDSYVEVNNFYTATVYEKGSELIRMIETLAGRETFVRGVQEYLRRHDGQAATIEDFLAAQEAVLGQSLDGFRRWYSQAGTPVVRASDRYDPATRSYTLRLSQHTPPTPGQAHKQPVPIPIRFALLDAMGQAIPLDGRPPPMPRDDLILLERAEAELRFADVSEPPTPAFLHGFSAPVRLEYDWRPEQRLNLLLHGGDAYVRWEAAQGLMLDAFRECLHGGRNAATAALFEGMQRLAMNPPEDKALLAELLRLPSSAYLAEQMDLMDPPHAETVRAGLRGEIARALTGPLSVWAEWAPEEQEARCAGKRALGNLALWYLASTGAERVLELARRRVWSSRSMTLVQGALAALNDFDCAQRDAALGHFYQQWRGDALVFDKWFALEAASMAPGIDGRIKRLVAHPDFDARNPNRVRAVLGVFSRENLLGFHAADGSGYRLLEEWVARLDRSNPQLAARLCDPLLGWRRYRPPYAALMKESLERLHADCDSPDVREKLEKALGG
ncbi:MAG: aminopeptidase N [Gammaproteobacteria bacterium]|nr:aminopeptidase N [Gammaproteobacteria bacterium]